MAKLAGVVHLQCPDEKVSFILEDGHKNVGNAHAIFLQTKHRGHSAYMLPLGAFATASKSEYRALQAADLISYETHCYLDSLYGVTRKSTSYYLELDKIQTLSGWMNYEAMKRQGEACKQIGDLYREYGGRPPGILFQKPRGALAPEVARMLEERIRIEAKDILYPEEI